MPCLVSLTESTCTHKCGLKSWFVHMYSICEVLDVHVKSYTAVNKAYKMLQDEEQKEYLEGVVEEAKGMVEKKVHVHYNEKVAVCFSVCLCKGKTFALHYLSKCICWHYQRYRGNYQQLYLVQYIALHLQVMVQCCNLCVQYVHGSTCALLLLVHTMLAMCVHVHIYIFC